MHRPVHEMPCMPNENDSIEVGTLDRNATLTDHTVVTFNCRFDLTPNKIMILIIRMNTSQHLTCGLPT